MKTASYSDRKIISKISSFIISLLPA